MNEVENSNRWASADRAFSKGVEAYIEFGQECARLNSDGTTQQEIGNRYQMAQKSVSEAITVGSDKRLIRDTYNLPRSTYSLYLLTTLDDKGFELLAKPETTQADIKAYKEAQKPPKRFPEQKKEEEEMKRYSWIRHAFERGYLPSNSGGGQQGKLKERCSEIDGREDLFNESGKEALSAVFDKMDEAKKPQQQKDDEYKEHREEVKNLPETAKQKFDRLVAKELAAMRATYEQEVRDAAKAFVPELEVEYREKLERVKKREHVAKVLKDNITVSLCMEDYRFLLNVLHSDRTPTKEKMNKAFAIVKKLEPYVSAVRAREVIW